MSIAVHVPPIPALKPVPMVSILVPTHNRERFVEAAVRSALQQRYGNVEVLVGVNGCTDGTEALVRRFDDPRLVVLVHDKTISMYQNFNSLVQAARGEFVLVLSDDDVLAADAIEKLVRTADMHAARLVFGAVRVVRADGARLNYRLRPQFGRADWATAIRRYLRFDVAIYPCATLLPRAEVLAIGGYAEERFGFAADVALWMHVAVRCRHVAYCDAIVADYLVHGGNETAMASGERWRAALDGIGRALGQIDRLDRAEAPALFADFALYRAKCIAWTQADAATRSGWSVSSLTRSGRLVLAESADIAWPRRLEVLMRWFKHVVQHGLRRSTRPAGPPPLP